MARTGMEETGAVAKYAREEGREQRGTPKGDGKLFDFFLLLLSHSLCLSGKVGNADRILREWPHG